MGGCLLKPMVSIWLVVRQPDKKGFEAAVSVSGFSRQPGMDVGF